jgi:hypothetical protein
MRSFGHEPTQTSNPRVSMYQNQIQQENKAIPLQDRPRGFQEVEAPRFQDIRHMKVVRSSLHTGRLYPPGNILGTHFC